MHHVENARACMHVIFLCIIHYCEVESLHTLVHHTLDLQLAKNVGTSGELEICQWVPERN